MLTPIAYVPEVKPKKIEPRRGRVQLRATGSVDEADEAEDIFDVTGSGLLMPAALSLNFAPVEGASQKPQHPQGRLSEGTLKALLQVQEFKQRFA
jgi:hypothetical protein